MNSPLQQRKFSAHEHYDLVEKYETYFPWFDIQMTQISK